MRRESTLIILKQDSEKSAIERAVLRQKEIAQKRSHHTHWKMSSDQSSFLFLEST